jgi:hypothetical protein
MKKSQKYPVLWLCCTLVFLSLMAVSPAMAQCTMTSAQIDEAAGSCAAGDLDCFVLLAKRNLSCAANIAWYYMIMYAPDNPTAVKNSFLNELPYSLSLENDLRTATSAAYQANRNEQNAGSTTSANEYPYGQ